MRLVHASIPRGKRDAVLGFLDSEGIDYVVTEETSGRAFTHVVSFPLPTNAVGPVLDELKTIGVDGDAFTVVTDAETVVSDRFDELKAQYAEENGTDDRIARDELRARAEQLASPLPTYLALTVVSAVIATAGILLDSPATVVGSMVIAPLIGPAMSAAVGTVVDDGDLFSRGIRLQLVGMSVAVLAAGVFALLVQAVNFVPPGLDPTDLQQVRERLQPDFLSLVVALGAGTAGAVSLTTGVSSAIVGVMIAVALVPPAATVGIGLAFGLPSVALPAGILAVVNGLSVNLAALLVLWYSGYRPEYFFRHEEARAATIKRVAILLALIAVFSVFLGGVTLDTVQNAQTENDVRAAVEPVFEEGAYPELALLDLTVETGPQPDVFVLREVERVVVTVGVPPGGTSDGLAATLETRVEDAVGASVPVEIRYVSIEVVD